MQHSYSRTLQVLLYAAGNQYHNSQQIIQLPYPSDDTRLISGIARRVITQLFKPGIFYIKAGVGLLDLSDRNHQQLDLFHRGQSVKTDRLMATIDSINRRHGKNSIYTAAEGVHPKWLMRQAYRSPAYTSRWEELPEIQC